MAASIQQVFTTSWSGVNDIDITLPSPAVENDVIILHISIGALGFTQEATTDWTNLLGPDNTQFANSDFTAGGVLMYHSVTAAEEAALTVDWTLLNIFSVPEGGDVIGTVWRDLDVAPFLNAFDEAENAAAVTPHVLAGIGAGAITVSGAPILSYIIKDGLGTYTTPPGVSLIASTNTTMGTALYLHDATSTDTLPVAPINITPSGADEYISLTYVLEPAPGAADDFTEDPIDAIGITDATEQSLGIGLTATDNVGVTDSVDVVASTLVEEVDDIGITDTAVIALTNIFEPPAEAIGITEHVLIAVDDVIAGEADAIGILDSVSTVLSLQSFPVDNIGILDSTVRAVDKARTLGPDLVGITDVVSVTTAQPLVTIGDLIGILDEVDTILTGPAEGNICLEFGLPVFVSRVAGVALLERQTGLEVRERVASLAMQERDASLTFVNREGGLDLGCEE